MRTDGADGGAGTRDPGLDALVEAVAGGQPLDWEREEARAGDAESLQRVRTLHDLARVAAFHRDLQKGAGDSDLLAIGRWGELLLLETLGAGADGSVYRAWDPALRREVALKLARPDGASEAMLGEARALARVRDPHVVTVHGAGEHGGRAGFWMEYLRGPSLAAELARRPLAPAEVARLGAQLAGALAAVHAVGVLHRDLKPANVVTEADGRHVLVDFGLGQLAGGGAPARPFSGTPLFMSPQRLGGATACAADDLYALGVTLRWALTGRPPFRAETLDALRAEAATGPATALGAERPDAPAALVAAVDRLMAPRPADRFASAADAQAAFAELARTLPAPTAVPAAPDTRRAPAPLLALGAVVVAVAALVLFARRAPERAPAPAPAPAPAALTYDVSATLQRAGATGSVPLADGDRVGPGDQLQLEFRATRPAWVYVLNADDHGETWLLFPQPLFDRANPLPADSLVRLPGPRAGREAGWVVTSRGGHEHFLVVASPAPVAELEAELAALPAPSPDRPIAYARVGAQPLERLRGVGGVADLPASPGTAAPSAAFTRFRALAGGEQGVRGVWVRQVTLRNPER